MPFSIASLLEAVLESELFLISLHNIAACYHPGRSAPSIVGLSPRELRGLQGPYRPNPTHDPHDTVSPRVVHAFGLLLSVVSADSHDLEDKQ
ncbi:hypothetical protein N7454_010302 [Penicillium verhagenii]|nr:hypothetical protein N7454_010302 [Penicillium verhagenii]